MEADLSDEAEVGFTSTVATDSSLDGGFRFDDPSIGIAWPISTPIVGERDAQLPAFDAVADDLAQEFAEVGGTTRAVLRNTVVRTPSASA